MILRFLAGKNLARFLEIYRIFLGFINFEMLSPEFLKFLYFIPIIIFPSKVCGYPTVGAARGIIPGNEHCYSNIECDINITILT